MKSRIHPGWYVAAATFVVLLVGAAIRATPGVLMVPLERELGWSRATISVAVSINLLLYGLAGPFCAAIAQRFGVRRTIAVAMGALAVAIGLATAMRSPWQLIVLWGVFVGAGTGMTANVMGAVVATRWFVQRRGLVLGALTAATATGQLLFLPVLARLAEGASWRASLWLVAGAALLMVPVALRFVRERPSDLGLRPYGAVTDDEVAAPMSQNPARTAVDTLWRAMHARDFWLL